MTVFYVLTKIFTFPGALTKALFEQIMCRIFKSPVEDNRYLRTDEMCGHVEHELIERPAASYFFCFIPGLLNFLLGLTVGMFAFINIVALGNYSGFIGSVQAISNAISDETLKILLDAVLPWFFMWLSFSMFANVAPLYEDALVMKEQYGKLGGFAKVILFPGYILMRISARLESMGLSFVILAALVFAGAVI